MEIHIFIHVCLLQTFTGITWSKEEVRLDIDTVASMFFGLDTPLVELIVGFEVGRWSYKMVHFLIGVFCVELVEFFEGDGFEWRAVGFRVVDDETLFAFHFGSVGCD